jgi:hypothetical protein
LASHKSAVGQSVRFSPSRFDLFAPRGGVFRVLRLLPEEANVFQHRVKSADDARPLPSATTACLPAPNSVLGSSLKGSVSRTFHRV